MVFFPRQHIIYNEVKAVLCLSCLRSDLRCSEDTFSSSAAELVTNKICELLVNYVAYIRTNTKDANLIREVKTNLFRRV